MAKILLAEDDEFFRSVLKSYLESKKHQVDEAPDGAKARNALKLSNYDLLITDMQMPFLNGIELLEWVKKEKPIPVIVMTGFSNILETKSAYALGADEFLAKPFKNDQLDEAIGHALKIDHSEQKVLTEIDSNFCKVFIDEFVSKPDIDFDVYVRLSKFKYVKIGYKNSQLPTDQIQNYKLKGMRYLHIHREDFGKLVDFNLDMSKLIANSDKVSGEKKMNFLKYTGSRDWSFNVCYYDCT